MAPFLYALCAIGIAGFIVWMVHEPAAPADGGQPVRRGARGWIVFCAAWPVRHWRGELSLGYAFWLNGFLGNIAVYIVVNLARAGLKGAGAGTWLAVFLAVWAFKLGVLTWQSVGTWRSAGRHVGRGGTRFWAITGKVMVGFAIGVTFFELFFALISRAWPT